MRVIRWKAVVPLGLTLVLVAAFWWLFLDFAVERAVEYAGTEIVGARVDLASADVSLGRGSVVLRGLEVTNPERPMTNLVQSSEIVAQVRVLPLLEKKVVIDTMAIRGVRFGTPRRRSLKRTLPHNISRRISGVQREQTTSAAIATGQN